MNNKALPTLSFEAHSPRQLDRWSLLIVVAALVIGGGIAIAVGKLGYFALLAVPGVLIVFGAVRQPEFGFVGLLLLVFTQINQVVDLYHEGIPSPARPLIAILVVVVLVRILLFGERQLNWVRTSSILGLYILFLLISVVTAQELEVAKNNFVSVTENILIAILVVFFIQRPSSFKIAIWTIIAAGIFMGSISVFQYLTGTFGNNYWGFGGWELQQSGEVSRHRLTGPYLNPNAYAQVLVVIIPLAIDRLWHERNIIYRFLAGWGVLVCTLTVIFTFSRNGFVSMIFAVGILFVLRRPNFLPTVVTIAIFFTVLQFIPSTYLDRVSSLLLLSQGKNSVVTDESLRGRLSENIAALQMFQDHPIFGVGLNNFQYQYQNYSRRIGIDPRRDLRSPASLYLEILSEQGLFGVLIFLYLIYTVLKSLFVSLQYFKRTGFKNLEYMTAALIASFGGYMFLAISKNSAYSKVYWCIVAISLALPQLVDGIKAEKEEPEEFLEPRI